MQKNDTTALEMTKLRIRIARLRFGFLLLEDAAAHIEAQKAILKSNGEPASGRAYASYERGERNLSPRILEQIEAAFRVQPRGWLSRGSGETEQELRIMLRKAEQEAKKKSREKRLSNLPVTDSLNGLVGGAVNQLTANNDDFAISQSQIVPIRRIPVLTGDQIAQFRAGKRDFPMTGQAYVLLDSVEPSDTIFCHIIPETDHSMEGAEAISFPPGTRCIIDTALDIEPGHWVLVRMKGMQNWLLRQYRAGLPLSLAKEYTLWAINPAVEAIRVTDPKEWEVGGRMIESQTTRKW
jgi:transcriptional regulator with XRE-family HTH domain